MERRKFLTSGLLAAGAAFVPTVGSKASSKKQPLSSFNVSDKGFNLNYAPHDGMFRNHAGNDFLDQIRFMKDQGFNAIEDNGLMGRTPEMQQKIGDLLSKLDMQMGVFVVDKGGNGANTFAAGKQEHTDIFLNGCRKAVEVAKRVNAKWMTVVPGNFARHIPMDIQTANVIETLRKGAEIMEPHGLVMVLEPLSDTPDLFLRYAEQTYLICKAVGSPSCKILYDIYHMQRNRGDLISIMDQCWDEIAYIQVGDNPGRKEPGTGEINYQNIFKHLYHKGFKGIVGMEHGNAMSGKDGELALIRAYRKADDFL